MSPRTPPLLDDASMLNVEARDCRLDEKTTTGLRPRGTSLGAADGGGGHGVTRPRSVSPRGVVDLDQRNTIQARPGEFVPVGRTRRPRGHDFATGIHLTEALDLSK